MRPNFCLDGQIDRNRVGKFDKAPDTTSSRSGAIMNTNVMLPFSLSITLPCIHKLVC